MNKRLRIFLWIFAACSWVYVIYKLCTYSEWAVLSERMRETLSECWWLGVLLLMPLNILFEALRWRTLLGKEQPMSVRESFVAVLRGYVGGVGTPWRAADYVYRLNDEERMLERWGLGMTGGVLMTTVIILFGLPSAIVYFFFYPQQDTMLLFSRWLIIFAILTAVILLTLFIGKVRRWAKRIVAAIRTLGTKGICITTVWTVCRYLTFCLQYYLCLRMFTVELTGIALLGIPTYYLFVTVLQTNIALDGLVRAGMSVFVFAPLGIGWVELSMAGMVLWLLNNLLPLTAGSILAVRKLRQT